MIPHNIEFISQKQTWCTKNYSMSPAGYNLRSCFIMFPPCGMAWT